MEVMDDNCKNNRDNIENDKDENEDTCNNTMAEML